MVAAKKAVAKSVEPEEPGEEAPEPIKAAPKPLERRAVIGLTNRRVTTTDGTSVTLRLSGTSILPAAIADELVQAGVASYI